MSKRKKIYLACAGAAFVVLIFVDQYTKYLAQKYLRNAVAVTLIPRTFHLRYLENRGAAFGLFEGQRILFLILCAAFLCIAAVFLLRMPATPYYIPLYLTATGVCAGAAGNGIDRVVNGYVTDFLYFSLIDFPIFNVADIYVTVSGFLLVLYVCFMYKEEDFAFMRQKRGGKDAYGRED